MREPTRKTIDGEQYTFCQLPPKKSLKLLTRILKIIGAPIGAAIGTGGAALGAALGAAQDLLKALRASLTGRSTLALLSGNYAIG